MAGHDVDDDLAVLAKLPSAQLREKWAEVTGRPVPRVSPKLLRLALAFELQAKAYGGLSRNSQQRLDQYAACNARTRKVKAGMRLVREWNGVVHVVTIGEDGVIRWNERAWKSLSEIARNITGTRWSGPAFFGLKQKKTAA